MKIFYARPVFEKEPGTTAGLHVAADALGEGPVWDHRVNVLYWIDILGQCVSCYHPRSHSVRRVFLQDDRIGFALPTQNPTILVCGSQNGLFLLNFYTGEITRGAHPEKHLPRNQFNDAKVDPSGRRLLAGTMQTRVNKSDKRVPGSGKLYQIENIFSLGAIYPVSAVGNVTVSNGLGWSPDGREFYYIDTPTLQVARFRYDGHSGEISSHSVQNLERRSGKESEKGKEGAVGESNHLKKDVAYPMEAPGNPDGMCVDGEGFLWVAALRAGEVHRVDPKSGLVVAKVIVPTELVTSCSFGGPYLSQLFITTAQGTTLEAALETKQKKLLTPKETTTTTDTKNETSVLNAGELFVVETGISGLPMIPFRLMDSLTEKIGSKL